jgi:CheY-like chemotaxis protein
MPRKPVVLCVDDEWNGLEDRKMLLEEAACKVLIATSGADAFERVRFTDDGCLTVEVAADHDSKFPRAGLPRLMSDRCPLFMSRWTARSSACSHCWFVIF